MMKLSILGSGSSGNSALVVGGGVRLLIDAGLSAKQLAVRLAGLGVDPGSLDGIVLTHEHGDHVRGLDVFCRRFPVPVYCTAMTREVLLTGLRGAKDWRVVPSAGEFAVGGMRVATFRVPHDAVDPVGLVFRSGGSGVGVVSDVGYVTEAMVDGLRDVGTLFVEANYDEAMLAQDTKRPWSTKQRIAARHGHLSNEQTAGLVSAVAAPGLRRVVLGHLSEDCNCPVVAAGVVSAALAEAGYRGVEVCCAGRHEASPLWEAGGVEPEVAAAGGAAVRMSVQAELF